MKRRPRRPTRVPLPSRGEPVVAGMTKGDLQELLEFARRFEVAAGRVLDQVSADAMQQSGDGTPFIVHCYYWVDDQNQARLAAEWVPGRRGATFTRGDYPHVEHHSFGIRPPRQQEEVARWRAAGGASAGSTTPAVGTSTTAAPATTR